MKIRKILTLGVVSVVTCLSASALTDDEKQYLTIYGQFIYENSGIKELELNPEETGIFLEGIVSASKGAAMPTNLQEIGPKMQAYMQSRAKLVSDKTSKKNKDAGAVFLAEKEKDKEVKKTETGLRYKVIKQGSDEIAKNDSLVSVNYVGKFIDGKEFDSSKGKAVEFMLNQVIPGFSEGLKKIGKGGKIELYIPSELAYGDNPNPVIPAGSTLQFELEIVDIKDAPPAPKTEMLPQLQ